MTTALLYGKSAHSAAEKYIRDNETLPSKFDYLKQYLDIFKKIDGVSLCEYKMGLTRNLEEC